MTKKKQPKQLDAQKYAQQAAEARERVQLAKTKDERSKASRDLGNALKAERKCLMLMTSRC